MLALADRVRRWHEAQRPADVRFEVEPGVELERRWIPLDRVGIYVPRGLGLDARHVRRAGGRGGRAGARDLHAAGWRRTRRARGGAARARRGVGDRRRAGDRLPRVRRARRQDRRAGRAVRERREARGVARRSDRLSRRPFGGRRRARRGRRSAHRRARGRGAGRARSRGGVPRSSRRWRRRRRSRPSTSSCSARRRLWRRRCATPARSSSAPNSPVPAGDLGTGANHVLPTGGWARSVGGLGLETFLKPITVQRLTAEGLARVRPTVEALAAVEGLPAHAAAVAR